MKNIASLTLCILVLTGTNAWSAAAQTADALPAAAEETRIEAALGSDAVLPLAAESELAQRLQTGTALLLAAPANPLIASRDRAIASETSAPALAVQQNRRGGLTFLIVGASLIAAGLLIDGDAGAVVSVGGALIGAYGVYLLVRD